MNSEYEFVYGVTTLDDLHNFFPDILYNHSRFMNVGDLLDYFHESVQHRFDIYSYNMARYTSLHSPLLSTVHQGIVPPSWRRERPSLTLPYMQPRQGVRIGRTDIPMRPQTGAATTTTSPIQARFEIESVGGLTDTSDLVSAIMRTLGVQATGTFMDPVVVRPTREQIQNATTIVNDTTTPVDEVCSICQDTLRRAGNNETGTVRRINHCGHCFHDDCIQHWFENSVRCPVCRYDIRGTGPTGPTGNSQAPRL